MCEINQICDIGNMDHQFSSSSSLKESLKLLVGKIQAYATNVQIVTGRRMIISVGTSRDNDYMEIPLGMDSDLIDEITSVFRSHERYSDIRYYYITANPLVNFQSENDDGTEQVFHETGVRVQKFPTTTDVMFFKLGHDEDLLVRGIREASTRYT